MAVNDVIDASKSKLLSLIAPINGGVGQDASYDPLFESLKSEVDKLTSLAGGKVDWGSMISNCDELLTDRSKDFRVAIYYAAAKSQTDGPRGLLDGLVLLQELCAAYWDTMYPSLKRPRARGNLTAWYGDLAVSAIAGFQPVAKDADLVGALDLVSRTVDGELRDKLADAYGGLGALRQGIRNLVQILPKEAPPPPPPAPPPPPPKFEAVAAPTPVAPVAPVAAAAPVGPASGFGPPPLPVAVAQPSLSSITDADSALKVLEDCSLLLARAGDALRIADPQNPLAYAYGRTGFWLFLRQSPHAEEGRTLLPAPSEMLRMRFDDLAAAENWLGLIHDADTAAAEHVFWLDPHRFIASAMDRLGPSYEPAKKAVIWELALLLRRAPGLHELAFNDGTPFADAATKAWIESEVLNVLGSGGGGAGPISPLDAAIREARGLLGSAKLPEAIAVIAKASAGEASLALRFRGKLAMAELCIQAEQFVIARAQLEGLERVAEQYRLAEWDPDLCSALYSALYVAQRSANRLLGHEVTPEAVQREVAIFDRLCQFDAAAAVKLTSS